MPGDEHPVTRGECKEEHKALLEEVHACIGSLKSFVITSITLMAVMYIGSFVLILALIPRDVPPQSFIDRVNRLEAAIEVRNDKLEVKLEALKLQLDAKASTNPAGHKT